MIPKKMVDRYAHQSGVKDQLVAEREVVLTYALHAMSDANVLDLLAFKGGTCLRKIIFGSTGRFPSHRVSARRPLESAPTFRVPVLRCPLAVISGTPLRDLDNQKVVLKIEGVARPRRGAFVSRLGATKRTAFNRWTRRARSSLYCAFPDR